MGFSTLRAKLAIMVCRAARSGAALVSEFVGDIYCVDARRKICMWALLSRSMTIVMLT